jgi:hypothetical protein
MPTTSANRRFLDAARRRDGHLDADRRQFPRDRGRRGLPQAADAELPNRGTGRVSPPMRPATVADQVALAHRVRRYVRDPARVWAARRDPAERDRQVLQAVRVRFPDAADLFGQAAVLASALVADGAGCRWCHAAAGGRGLPPATEAVLELLGPPCLGCGQVLLDRVTGHLEQDVADSQPVTAAAEHRRPPDPPYYRRRLRWPTT